MHACACSRISEVPQRGHLCLSHTVLHAGRASPGSYALHHYLSHVELLPPPWYPGDIDVFFAVPDGADAVELRHRVEARWRGAARRS